MRIFSRLMLSTALLGTVAAPAMAQGVIAPVHRAIPHVHTVAAVQPAPVAALPGVVATAPAMPGPATTTAPHDRAHDREHGQADQARRDDPRHAHRPLGHTRRGPRQLIQPHAGGCAGVRPAA